MKSVIIKFLEWYLLRLARVILAKYKPVVIGITGSVGKTTAKEAIAHLLKTAKRPALKTEGNLNADIGIGLTVLGYDHSPAIWEWPYAFILMHIRWLLLVAGIRRLPEYFVVEMGVDRLGDMRRMARIVRPSIGVITWIGEGHHLEYLKDAPTVAREKGQLLAILPADGLAVIPAADPNVKILRELANAPTAEFTATGMSSLAEIAAIIGKRLDIPQKTVDKAMDTFKQPKGRLNEFPGINDSRILDDSYNISVPAAREALSILAQGKAKRKVAILGDILEQGSFEEEYHQKLAEMAAKQSDLFIAVGRRMAKVKTDYWFPSPDEAAAEVHKLVKAGDLVLVKGSQGMRMEKVSLSLAKNKKTAERLLPRQGFRWRQIPFRNP